MENKTSHKEADDEEIVVLLRSLRVEATPEAYFEERFLYEFHERLAHEVVNRPARTLLWEHLQQVLSNIGRRRLIWGASSVSFGALCLGLLFSLQGRVASRHQAAESIAVQSLMPGASAATAEAAVRTTVHPHATRRSFTERLLATRSEDTAASYLNWGVAEDDMNHAGMFSQPSFPGSFEWDASVPDLLMHVVH